MSTSQLSVDGRMDVKPLDCDEEWMSAVRRWENGCQLSGEWISISVDHHAFVTERLDLYFAMKFAWDSIPTLSLLALGLGPYKAVDLL